MYGFKQLLVLALAQSALACQCTEYGLPTGNLDSTATEQACAHTGGTMSGRHGECLKACHSRFFTLCQEYRGVWSNLKGLQSTCLDDGAFCG